MATQTSTTGSLENASLEMIKAARFTEEHNAPCLQLIQHFTMPQGHDTLIVPKVGQMSMSRLTEGQENTNEQDIGMTTVSVQTSSVGAKVVITDKLLQQNSQDIWGIVGRQMGEGMARIKDTDIIALFAALNGGTAYGAAGAIFSSANVAGILSRALSNNFGSDLAVVHHPNAIGRLSRDLSTVGSGVVRPIPSGFSAERLAKFFDGIVLNGVPFLHDGNISRDSSDDAIGGIFDNGAMGIVTSGQVRREKQRKAEIGTGAWALYVTAEYEVFEIDDSRGAPLTYDAVDPPTS